MKNFNIAEQHATVLKEINDGFTLSQIIFKEKGLVYDTNAVSYWKISNEENVVHIAPKSGINCFGVSIIRNGVTREFEIPVYPENLVEKFRRRDLIYFIAECFDFEEHKPKGDLTLNEQKRFLDLSALFLEFHGDNAEDVMKDIDPKQISSVVSADLLFDCVKASLLKFKENQGALDEVVKVMQGYEELNEKDKFNRQKLNYILDRAEKIAEKYL